MILTQYLRKNIFRTFVVTFSIWLMLFIVQQLIVAFNKVSHGAFPTDFIFKFITLNLPSVMIYFVPFALFLGILLTFIRMYNNQEIIAMFSCGIKYRTVFFSFFPLTIVVALFNLANSLYISPTLLTESYNEISYLRNNPTFSLLKPGSFNNIPGTNYIVFAQTISGNQAQDVYIFNLNHDLDQTDNTFIYAQKALIANVNGKRQIQLLNGQMIEQKLNSNLFQQLILQLPVLAKHKIAQYCLVNYPQVKSELTALAQDPKTLNPSIDQSAVNLSVLSQQNPSSFSERDCRHALMQFALANQVVTPSSAVDVDANTNADFNEQAKLNDSHASHELDSTNSSSAVASDTATDQNQLDPNSSNLADQNNPNSASNPSTQSQVHLDLSDLENMSADDKANATEINPNLGQQFTVGGFTFRGFNDKTIQYNPQLALPGQAFKPSQYKQAYNQALIHAQATNDGALIFNSKNYDLGNFSKNPNLKGNLYVIDFKSLHVNLNTNNLEENLSRFKYQTITQLLDSNQPNAKVEIIFRIISSLSILMLAIMAFTFGKVNPRSTKNGNIIIAVVLYFVYLLISQSFRGLISRNVPLSNGLIVYVSTNVVFVILIYLLTTDNVLIKNNKFVDRLRYFFGVQ